MSENRRLPAFENFIQAARAFCAVNPDTEARMKRITILLEGLVRDPTLREHSKYWPSTESRKIHSEKDGVDGSVAVIVRSERLVGKVL